MDDLIKSLVSHEQVSANLVALGAIVSQHNKVLGSAAYGKRKKGNLVEVSISDRWHIGSITKSITATMIARLVERGELNWNSPIKELLSKTDQIHSDWLNVTLDDLLTHTSGAPTNFPIWTLFKKPPEGVQRTTQRLTEVTTILKNKPASKAGTSFDYSNVGYTIAGVIAEQKTGKTWEDLVKDEVFTPLALTSAGFGPPQDSNGELSQPRGHQRLFGFKRPVGTEQDNSPIMGPAGSICMSLQDLVRYGNEHLQGKQDKGVLINAQSFQKLHTPRLDEYAFGWVVTPDEKMKIDPIVWHNGSNTMWYALLVLIPQLHTVIAVTSNDGSVAQAEASAWRIVEKVVSAIKGY